MPFKVLYKGVCFMVLCGTFYCRFTFVGCLRHGSAAGVAWQCGRCATYVERRLCGDAGGIMCWIVECGEGGVKRKRGAHRLRASLQIK